MNTKLYMQVAGVTGRILLAFLFVFSQSVWAGQDQNTKDKADSAQKASAQQVQEKQTHVAPARVQSEEAQSTAEARSAAEETPVAEEKPSGDGSREGIKVHGHWTIEVRNPDGTLVAHREFENSLQQGGTLELAGILGHQLTPGFWSTTLLTSPNCGSPLIANGNCLIAEPSSGFNATTNLSNNLIATVTNNGASLTLSGSIQVSVALQVTAVATTLNICSATSAPVACVQGATLLPLGHFTSTNRTTPDVVQAGQIVQVTVVMSFS